MVGIAIWSGFINAITTEFTKAWKIRIFQIGQKKIKSVKKYKEPSFIMLPYFLLKGQDLAFILQPPNIYRSMAEQ